VADNKFAESAAVSMLIWRDGSFKLISVGNALCGWQEATKLDSLGSKRPQVSLLERKEICSMTSGVS
jgi:hypothetical protein